MWWFFVWEEKKSRKKWSHVLLSYRHNNELLHRCECNRRELRENAITENMVLSRDKNTKWTLTARGSEWNFAEFANRHNWVGFDFTWKFVTKLIRGPKPLWWILWTELAHVTHFYALLFCACRSETTTHTHICVCYVCVRVCANKLIADFI